MRRVIRFIAMSLGVMLVLLVAVGAMSLLTFFYRSDRQNQKLVKSISDKLAPVVANAPEIIWDTDLLPFGFPQDNFDSPYVTYVAPSTVAISDSLAAVTFRKSRYEGKQLVQDGHLITVSLATGSVVTTTQWPAEWQRKVVFAPFWQKLIGVGPYVYCCNKEGYFYGYSDGYLVIKGGKPVGRQEGSPGGLITDKPTVKLGTNGRPSTVEISHEDGSKSSFQTDCAGNVHPSFVSKNTLVVIGCGTLSVMGTDAKLVFSDAFEGAEVIFGGASKNGRRFVISVAAWHAGDPRYLTDEWLVVYDVERGEPVFAVRSNPLPYLQSESALSTDGDRLLTGSGGHLKLLRLPN